MCSLKAGVVGNLNCGKWPGNLKVFVLFFVKQFVSKIVTCNSNVHFHLYKHRHESVCVGGESTRVSFQPTTKK